MRTRWIQALAAVAYFLPCAGFAEITFSPPVGESALGVVTYGVISVVGRMNNAGHSALYFPNICPDTPFKLRKCEPGEAGSVMSRYASMGESEDGTRVGKDWSVTPVMPHFYGVEKPEDAPIIATPEISLALKEYNRQKYFSKYVRAPRKGETLSPGEWESDFAILAERGVDIVVVDIDDKEAQSMIDFFNESPNQAGFNILWANCADESKSGFNHLFPGSVHRSIKDFMMTSPMAVMKGAAKFGMKNPERRMRFVTLQQLPGTYKFDGPVRSGMENAWKEWHYLLPLLHAPHYLVPFTIISLFDTFNKDKVRVQYPNLEVAELRNELSTLKEDGEPDGKGSRIAELKKNISTRVNELATREDGAFASYRTRMTGLISRATEEGFLTPAQDRILRGDHPQNYLKGYQGKDVVVRMDPARGLLLTQTSPTRGQRTAGVSPTNLEREDPSLGFELVVGAVNYMLAVPKKDRPALEDFERNWQLMTRLGARIGFKVSTN